MQQLNKLVLTVAKEETRLVGVSRAECAPGFATNKGAFEDCAFTSGGGKSRKQSSAGK